MATVVWIGLQAVAAYGAIGVVVAVALHVVGLVRIDPATRGAGWLFRVLITPGLIALWPVMVLRWRWARPTGTPAGGVHRPVTSEGLRVFHRRLVFSLAVVVPLLAGAGIAFRPGRPAVDPRADGVLPEPAALSDVLATHPRPFGDLPVRLVVRGDASGRRQLELELDADPGVPTLLLYWARDESEFPGGAVYLGRVWGPGTRRYDVDETEIRAGGVLMVVSLAHRERVASFELSGE